VCTARKESNKSRKQKKQTKKVVKIQFSNGPV